MSANNLRKQTRKRAADLSVFGWRWNCCLILEKKEIGQEMLQSAIA